MRFLSTFLTLSLLIIVVLAVGFYFSREYILYQGVENFKKSVLVLEKTNADVCNKKAADLLGLAPTDKAAQVQLRFTSDTDYVLEVICPRFEFDPVVMETRTLDKFVTKIPGTSGILLTEERSGVELAVFSSLQQRINKWVGKNIPLIEKKRAVVLENNGFVVVQPGEPLGSGPLTSCQGYGYQCCQADSQIGVGNRIDGLLGCETSCYSSCSRRPVVLSFTSNPFFDVNNRTVTLSKGESVDFAYVVDMAGLQGQVFIDYGDGRSDQSLENTGTVSHSYDCIADSCEYTASIRATDTAGVDSVSTAVTQLKVIVGG